MSRTDCEGDSSPESASAGSAVVGLEVNGEDVDLLTEPNGPGQRFDAPDDRGHVEIQTVQVQPQEDANGWTTTALVVRVVTRTPLVVVTPDELRMVQELRFGITSTTVECAAA